MVNHLSSDHVSTIFLLSGYTHSGFSKNRFFVPISKYAYIQVKTHKILYRSKKYSGSYTQICKDALEGLKVGVAEARSAGAYLKRCSFHLPLYCIEIHCVIVQECPSYTCQPQWVHSYRRKGERIIMFAINKWWRYCRYRCYF